jgi:hypothetical protein
LWKSTKIKKKLVFNFGMFSIIIQYTQCPANTHRELLPFFPLVHNIDMECEEEEPMESVNLSPPSPSTHPQPPCQLGLPLEAISCSSGSSPAPGQLQGQEAEDVGVYRSPCSPQISLAQYNAQAGDYTQQALRELKASPEYKKHIQTCHRLFEIFVAARMYNIIYVSECHVAVYYYCVFCTCSCGVRWYNGEWSHGCPECGEGAMQLPCPICKGRCGRVWRRDLELVSHGVAFSGMI